MQTLKKWCFMLLLPATLCCGSEKCRIVSLAPALTEIVCYLGGGKSLVGRCSACDYPPEVRALPAVGRFGMVKLEKIIALKPDWVIANDLMNPYIAEKLQRSRIETVLAQINTIEDYRFWLRRIGSKLDKTREAELALQRLEDEKAALMALNALPLKVLWVVNAKPLIVAGSGSLPDAALKLMKMENAAGNVKNQYFKCSAEWVLSSHIDLIIWGVPGLPQNSGAFWSKVAAVKNNMVVCHDIYDPVTRPGPRFMKAVQKLRWKVEQLTGAEKEKAVQKK